MGFMGIWYQVYMALNSDNPALPHPATCNISEQYYLKTTFDLSLPPPLG